MEETHPPLKITPPIGDAIIGYDWYRVTIGESSARTYHLQRQGHPDMYLKIDDNQPVRKLLEEKSNLEWLADKIPAPRVLLSAVDEGYDYLLTTGVPGTNAAHLSGRIDSTELVTLLGQGLRMIHDVDIANCPFDRSLDKEIEAASFNLEHGFVNESDFDGVRRGQTAGVLYRELLLRRPADEDLVFTHGDYCLPNIIVHEKKLSGFVDWHRAGIGDRYRDIALVLRSIERNLGTGFAPALFAAYGITEPDEAKLDYYLLLDEFF
jgi:aminoglycoside phosphotransferase